MSPRFFCSVAALLCAVAPAIACDKCPQGGVAQPFQPSYYQPHIGLPGATPGFQPVIPVGTSQTSPYGASQFGVAGGFSTQNHSPCTDPNCRTCPSNAVFAPYGSAPVGQCSPNCSHPGGQCPAGGCSAGACGCSGGYSNFGDVNSVAIRPGFCPVDGRPLGQFGQPHSVVVNGAIVHTCSGQCANVLRGYGSPSIMQPARFDPSRPPVFTPSLR